MNRLPTKDNLISRGINVPSSLYTIFMDQVEKNVIHFFLVCKFAKALIQKLNQ